MSDVINIAIRVMPKGDELEVELPVFSTGKDIIEELLTANVAPRHDGEGNPYVYELISKASTIKIEEHKTLYDLGIREGETIYFTPKISAGSV